MRIKDIFTTTYGEWQVFFKIGKSKWKLFKGEKGYWYADPTLIEHNGEIYLFTEAFNNMSQIGRIAVSKLESDSFSEPNIIIKKPYHLSYPCVFEYKDEVYMIPESSQNHTLELYKSLDSEMERWEKVKVLVSNVDYVDSTVFQYYEKTYLITYIQSKDKYITKVFLLDMEKYTLEEIYEHIDKSNISRPAGKVFFNGGYYRPVQYNINCYGEKMRILRINPDNNDWMGEEDYDLDIHTLGLEGVTKTHTYNSVGKVTVVDGLREYKSILTPYYVIKRKMHNFVFKMKG